MKLNRRKFLWQNIKLALGAITASLATGNPKGAIAKEMEGEYTIREGTFQHIVLEGTSYEVGKMQGEIIKETKDKEPLASFASNDDVHEKLGFENFNEMKALYEDLCPGIMDELQGLADSLDIPVEKIAFCQVLIQLHFGNTFCFSFFLIFCDFNYLYRNRNYFVVCNYSSKT